MRVKICGVKNEEDIKVAIKSGTDAVGFLVGQMHPSPDFIVTSTAARLIGLLPPYISPVIVTHLNDPEEILNIMMKTGARTVQLYGDNTVEEIKILHDSLPVNSKIIMAVHVTGYNQDLELDKYYPYINAIILDSINVEKGQVGGTGLTHNWNISAEIVKNSPIPVILAGGLNANNVKEAIKTVQPYGVDANTYLRDSNGNRSLEKCCDFVKNAKQSIF